MRYLIRSFIGDDERRRRVVKRLRKCAHRVQLSVLEGALSEAAWRAQWRDLEKIIDPKADRLRLVPICGGCGVKRRQSGTTGQVAVDEEVVT